MYVAAAIIVGGIIGAVASKDASRKAANTAADAAKLAAETTKETATEANDLQWKMYQQTRADTLPWMQAGTENLTKLNALVEAGPGEFKNSSYYNLGLEDANKATDYYLNSRGLFDSGKASKDLQANAVKLNDANRTGWLNEWIATKLNPVQSLAQVGLTATTNNSNNALSTARTTGNNLINSGNQQAGYIMDAGQTKASSIINNANTTNQSLQGIANALSAYYGYKSPTTAT